MSGGAARRLCPNLIEVAPRFDAYTAASKAVFEIFRDTSPIVEPMSIEEAFIDVAGRWLIVGSGRGIRRQTRLPAPIAGATPVGRGDGHGDQVARSRHPHGGDVGPMSPVAIVGRTITLRLRFGDVTRAIRSRSLPDATSSTAVIHATAVGVLDATWPIVKTRGISPLGLSLGNLSYRDAVQLVLPFERCEAEQLDTVLDAAHERFGRTALQRATTLRDDSGVQLPMLAD